MAKYTKPLDEELKAEAPDETKRQELEWRAKHFRGKLNLSGGVYSWDELFVELADLLVDIVENLC